ncbi:MAG: hypothetical protein AB1505_29685 [Candidatus Latescibacterota bacterium]
MRKSIFVCAVALALIAGGAVFAQNLNSNDIGYFALQTPDPAAISIDARDNDWRWFDPAYVIGVDQLKSTVQNPMPDRADWDASFRVAWSAPGQGGEGYENMWYVFVLVTDDILSHSTVDPDMGFNEDDVEFSTDMDNGGGNYNDRINAQQWTYHLATDGYPHVGHLRFQLPPEMQWGMQPPYGVAAARVEPEGATNLSTNVTVYYEWKLAAWDTYLPAGPDASTRHNMTAGETVNTVVQVNERDDGGWENQIGTCASNKGGNGNDASLMSQFTLLGVGDYATAVQAESWAAIKALYR